MNSFIINDIKICSPSDLFEMKNIMKSLLVDRTTKCISFINPEIFMQQEKNELLHSYFKDSKFNFIDGIGLLYAVNKKLKLNMTYKNRYPGTDFFEYLPDEKLKVYFFGGKPGVAELAAKELEKKYKNVNFVGLMNGYVDIDDDEIVEIINNTHPDILLVCKGCPKQELWIKENIKKLNVPLVFGNGGCLDFWSGNVRRANEFLIKNGLEWLYRLFQDFTIKRIKRQMKLIIFLIKYKFKLYDIRKEEDRLIF